MKAKTAQKIMEITNSSYNIIASEFSSTRNKTWPEFNQFSAYIKDKYNILDIGCGNGRFIEILKDKDIKYLGIDKSEAFIKIAKEKYPKNSFEVMDIMNLNLAKESFDLVFCIAVLNHIPSKDFQKQALRNIYHILKPGGRLLMTNWNLWTFSLKKKSVFKYFFKKIFSEKKEWELAYTIEQKDLGFKDLLTTWKLGKKNGILYYYAFTLNEIKNMLTDVGFEVEKAYYSKGKHKGGNIVTIALKK